MYIYGKKKIYIYTYIYVLYTEGCDQLWEHKKQSLKLINSMQVQAAMVTNAPGQTVKTPQERPFAKLPQPSDWVSQKPITNSMFGMEKHNFGSIAVSCIKSLE